MAWCSCLYVGQEAVAPNLAPNSWHFSHNETHYIDYMMFDHFLTWQLNILRNNIS